jgi:autotransporter-associated beta strand protein
VPDGPVAYNRTVSLTGNLRLVKEGAGVFVPVKQNQSYSGGTDITAGTLTLGAQGNTLPLGAKGSDITVRSEACFDRNSNVAFHHYGFTLDGGTFWSRGSDVADGSMIRRMRLTADSILDVDANFGFYGEDATKPTFVDLGGHTLELQIGAGKYFRNYNTTYINGTVDITSGGWFLTGGNGVTATDVDFKINCALYMAQQFNVRGYEANFYSTGSNSGTAQMTVAGTFRPTVLSYYGCTMLAGSTMDLTAWPGTWPMSSAFGANGKTDLEFADSGEIAVKLAGRDDLKALAKSENPHLFTWTVVDGNPVVPGATFVLDPATAAAGYRLRKDATGLKLVYTKGFMVIVM